MPIFGHLGSLPIRIWDEARLGINAFEMWKNNDFVVTYFEGEADMWNTKPPLLIWIQVICIKLFGFNEVSLRLPSAFAALFTCVIIFIFFKKYLKSTLWGFISVMVLVTTYGYIDQHVTRTADYDSMLIFFLTLSSLLFFSFIETKKNSYLYGYFVFTALAVLTKSSAGLLFTPAIFIYILIRKELINLLKNKHFYFGLAMFLVLVSLYYILREVRNPGYFKAVLDNELFGRYADTLEGHKHEFLFYFNNIKDNQFCNWIYFLPIGIALGLIYKNKRIYRINMFSIIIIISYFFIISFSATKLYWYSAPLFPFMAICISTFIYTIFEFIKNIKWFDDNIKYNIFPIVFLFLIFINPYSSIINKTYKPQEYSWDAEFYEIEYYLRNATTGKHDLNNKFFLYDGYYAQTLFYIIKLQEKGININYKDWKNLETGDVVFTSDNSIKDYIAHNYKSEIVEIDNNVITYKILEKYGKSEN